MKGSVQRRGKNWSVMVDMPRDPITGKRRQKRITAPTKREAEALAAQFVASLQNGGFAEPDAKLDFVHYQLNSKRRKPVYPRVSVGLNRHQGFVGMCDK